MKVYSLQDFKKQTTNAQIEQILENVKTCSLRHTLEQIVGPRDYSIHTHHNQFVGKWIATQFSDYGYDVYMQGVYNNVVALPKKTNTSLIAIAAHYDSVPQTPGADDNASAVAVMLECARLIVQYSLPICFIAFNREEDGLLGSYDFVKNLSSFPQQIDYVHVLEMVGYCSDKPNSQKIPQGIPITGIDVGNFIALIGNESATKQMEHTMTSIKTYLGNFPAIGLQTNLASSQFLHILKRSDHFPFWEAGIPALMWTDTAEFRNPHYHQKTDTIETLDFEFMRKVTTAVISNVLSETFT